jgi:predicted nucleic acid-binding protein
VTLSFLLDTDVLSDLRRRRPHPALVTWLQSVPPASLWMSTVTIAEIQCGISRVRDQAVASGVQLWLDGMLQDGRFGIVDLDLNAALTLGRMWATPALRDFLVSDPRSRKIKNGADLAIAAVSIARQMVIVTRNIDDFLRIHALFALPGLFNPFDTVWAVETEAPMLPPGPGDAAF